MFCRSLFVLALLIIVLSVHLRYTVSDYSFGIFKLFMTSGPSRVKPKTIQLICAASPMNTQHLGARTKTRIMWQNGSTDMSIKGLLVQTASSTPIAVCWSDTKTTPSYWHITCFRHDIVEKYPQRGAKYQYTTQSPYNGSNCFCFFYCNIVDMSKTYFTDCEQALE